MHPSKIPSTFNVASLQMTPSTWFFQLVFYGSHNKHHQQQQQRRMQEHSTSSAAHCVLANRPEIVSKSEPKSGVLGQRDGGGDDGRMPIMCGHKVMKILSDSGNSCTLSAPAFDLISKDRRELRVKDRGYRIDVPEPRKWYNTLWSACVSERYEYWSHLIEIWIANPPVAQKDSHLSGCVHTFRGNRWVRAAATITKTNPHPKIRIYENPRCAKTTIRPSTISF